MITKKTYTSEQYGEMTYRLNDDEVNFYLNQDDEQKMTFEFDSNDEAEEYYNKCSIEWAESMAGFITPSE